MVKVGLVYILAGTGVTDIAALPNTPDVMAKITANTIKFAPEVGRYIGAQLGLQAALGGGLPHCAEVVVALLPPSPGPRGAGARDADL